jgi:hypothetical protein
MPDGIHLGEIPTCHLLCQVVVSVINVTWSLSVKIACRGKSSSVSFNEICICDCFWMIAVVDFQSQLSFVCNHSYLSFKFCNCNSKCEVWEVMVGVDCLRGIPLCIKYDLWWLVMCAVTHFLQRLKFSKFLRNGYFTWRFSSKCVLKSALSG